MRRLLAALLLAARLVPAAGNLHLQTTFYAANTPPGTIDAVLDPPSASTGAPYLLEDGEKGTTPSATREFRSTLYGVTAILALDTSGSVQGAPFESVKAALRDYVSSSRPQDRIALVGFGDSVDVRQPFTSDKALLLAAIDGLRVGSRHTLLNAAIARSLGMLAAETSNPRRHLLVITDGKNEGPGPPLAELTETAATSGIPVDCLGVTRLTGRYLESMQALSLATGGAYLRAKGYDQLRQAMRRGIDGLLGTQVMTFHLAHVRADGRKHLLRIVTPDGLTNAISVLLPEPPASDTLLFVSVSAAVVLFGAGMLLILHSRKRQTKPLAAFPAATSAGPAPKARTATVYEAIDTSRPPKPPASRGAGGPGVLPNRPIQPTDRERAEAVPTAEPTEFRHVLPSPESGVPTAWFRLVSRSGSLIPNTRYPIDAAEIWIGSGEASRIHVQHDSTVSRSHACIQWIRGDLYLLDNRSTNGTMVNGAAVTPGSRVRLQFGDKVAIGESMFTVEPPDQPR